MPTRTEPLRAHRRGAWLLALACALAWSGAPAPAAAQPDEGGEQLQAAVGERFEVLPLRSGVLLRPIGGASYRAIEITGAGVAVDGDLLDSWELEERLGTDAELVGRLADLDPDDLASLLAPDAAGGEDTEDPDGRAESGDLEDRDQAVEEPADEWRREEEMDREPRRRVRSDARVSVGSSLVVEEDEEARDVVVIGGSLDVQGEVLGDAVAVGGSVSVDGRVTGDVVAVGGGLKLGPQAYILGDAVSVGGRIERHPDARVVGDVSEVAFAPGIHLGWLRFLDWDHRVGPRRMRSPWDRMTETAWRLLGLAVLGLLACLTLLVARRPVERMEAKVGEEAWKAGLTGLVAQILFVPLLGLILFVLVVSFVGIPLLALVPFALLALVLGAFAGYTAVAYRLGRWSEGRFGWRLGSPYVVLLVGVAIIQIWTFVGRALDLGGGPLKVFAFLLVFLGLLFQYLAWTVGFGAFLLTRFGTQAAWYPRRGTPLPPAPAAPPPQLQGPDVAERRDFPEGPEGPSEP
jgi:hypothetical protein